MTTPQACVQGAGKIICPNRAPRVQAWICLIARVQCARAPTLSVCACVFFMLFLTGLLVSLSSTSSPVDASIGRLPHALTVPNYIKRQMMTRPRARPRVLSELVLPSTSHLPLDPFVGGVCVRSVTRRAILQNTDGL